MSWRHVRSPVEGRVRHATSAPRSTCKGSRQGGVRHPREGTGELEPRDAVRLGNGIGDLGRKTTSPGYGDSVWIEWPSGGGRWRSRCTTERRRGCRSPRSPSGSVARWRRSKRTFTTRLMLTKDLQIVASSGSGFAAPWRVGCVGRPSRSGYGRPMAEMRTERSAARVRERGIELLEEAAEQSRPRIVAERVVANSSAPPARGGGSAAAHSEGPRGGSS